MSNVNRVWRLRKRPQGEISDDVLSFEREALPTPAEGQFLYRLDYLSLDPTNRIWMSDMDQYMPPVELGAPMRGVVCGTVIESRRADIAVGDVVAGLGSWSDYQLDHGMVVKLPLFPGIDVPTAFGTFIGVGPTAYFGLLDLGRPQPGETVVVSAAAGAVGSLVGQIARIQGARAVGLAGSDDKCRWITETLGFDAAINYRTEDVPAALARTCPAGIDVYFDNVGGPILDACLKRMNLHGRIPTCGLISSYNADGPVAGPYNYAMILMQRLCVEGFIITDYAPRFPEAITALAQWMQEGRIKVRLDVVDGLENALTTVKRLYTGGNTGKLMIRTGLS